LLLSGAVGKRPGFTLTLPSLSPAGHRWRALPKFTVAKGQFSTITQSAPSLAIGTSDQSCSFPENSAIIPP
jgi:hypothetical protein